MKITKIKIYNFGKLHDFSLAFDEGMNVIYGQNEAGKSTVLSFIKAMLYGFSGGKRSIGENERVKYTPWDGSKMGGELYFESKLTQNGCIRRTFGKTPKGDTLLVFDDVTGETLPVVDFGEEILDINMETFEKTAYIKQLGSGIGGKADDEISKKMVNLEESADEEVSFSKTKDLLLTQKRILKTTGNRGVIPNLENEMIALKEQKAMAKQREIQIRELLKLQNQLLDEKEKVKQKIEQVKENSWKSDCAKVQRLKVQLDEKQRELKSIHCEQSLEQIIKDREKNNRFRAKLEALQNEILGLNAQLKVYEKQQNKEVGELSETVENLRKRRNENEIKKEQIENLERQKKEILINTKKSNPLLIILSIFTALMSIGLGFFVNPYYYGIILVGIILFAITKLNFSHKSEAVLGREQLDRMIRDIILDEKVEDDILEIFSKIKVTNFKEYDKIKNEYNEVGVKIRLLQEQLQCKREQTGETEREYDELKDALTKMYLIENVTEQLDRIFGEKENEKKLLSEIELVQNAIEMITNGRNIEDYLNVLVDDFIEPIQNGEDYNLLHLDIVKKLADCENKMDLLSKEKPISLLESEVLGKVVQLEEANEKYATIEIAETAIDEAYRILESDFRPKLNALAGEYFSKITNGKYGTVRVSKDFKVLLESGEYLKELDYMSGGTADQFYISLRMAFLKLMNTNDEIPLFLDDSFIQFDQERTQNAFAFLIEFNTQKLYFTCKKEISKLAQQHGINCMEVF